MLNHDLFKKFWLLYYLWPRLPCGYRYTRRGGKMSDGTIVWRCKRRTLTHRTVQTSNFQMLKEKIVFELEDLKNLHLLDLKQCEFKKTWLDLKKIISILSCRLPAENLLIMKRPTFNIVRPLNRLRFVPSELCTVWGLYRPTFVPSDVCRSDVCTSTIYITHTKLTIFKILKLHKFVNFYNLRFFILKRCINSFKYYF